MLRVHWNRNELVSSLEPCARLVGCRLTKTSGAICFGTNCIFSARAQWTRRVEVRSALDVCFGCNNAGARVLFFHQIRFPLFGAHRLVHEVNIFFPRFDGSVPCERRKVGAVLFWSFMAKRRTVFVYSLKTISHNDLRRTLSTKHEPNSGLSSSMRMQKR